MRLAKYRRNLVYSVGAVAQLHVKAVEPIGYRCGVLLLSVRLQHEPEVNLVDGAAHVDKSEELGNAPKTAQERDPAEHHNLLATAQEDWQASQITINVVLVYATLVDPHPG